MIRVKDLAGGLVMLLALIPAWAGHAFDAARLDRMLEQGRYLEVRSYLQTATADLGRDSKLAFYRARVALKLDNPDAVREALAPYRKSGKLTAGMHRLLAAAAGMKAADASVFGALGEVKKIKRHFEQAVKLDPDDPLARLGLLRFHLQAPGLVGGSKDEAREQARALAEHDPALGRLARAILAAEDDRLADAIELARSAIELDPELQRARRLLARLAVEAERPGEALDHIEALLRQAPDHPEYNYRFASLAAEHGLRVDRAIEAARRYLDYANARAELGLDGGKRASGYYRLGKLCERVGLEKAAREAYNKALEIDPELETAADALGQLSTA